MSRILPPAPRGIARHASPLLVVLMLLAAGCGRHDRVIAPQASGDGAELSLSRAPVIDANRRRSTIGLYPLEVGNRWRYADVFTDDVVGDGLPPEEFRSTMEVEQIGTEQIAGRAYVIEEERVFEPQSVTIVSWWRYRSDRSGLYMADLPGNIPPGGGPSPDLVASSSDATVSALARMADRIARLSARNGWNLSRRMPLLQATRPATAIRRPGVLARPGGVGDNEITRLRYPLHPGQRWTIRDDPRFSAMVEGHEVLQLPAGRFSGWRIAITSELFGPNDRVRVWYGQAGFLALRAHLEGERTDEAGNPVGTFVFEQSERLEDLDLVRANPGH